MEIGVVGESQETARYAGMNVRKVILRTMFLSGAVCGIGGMVQATGSDVTLTTAVAGGVGFTAIIVAWLAQLNPPAILIVTVLFSILEKGKRRCAVFLRSVPQTVRTCFRELSCSSFWDASCSYGINSVMRGKGGAGA